MGKIRSYISVFIILVGFFLISNSEHHFNNLNHLCIPTKVSTNYHYQKLPISSKSFVDINSLSIFIENKIQLDNFIAQNPITVFASHYSQKTITVRFIKEDPKIETKILFLRI